MALTAFPNKPDPGFSRGAYQIRVIAGMIEKVRLSLLYLIRGRYETSTQVGLLHKGNTDQIPLCVLLFPW
jgi:hypothetical protein